MRIPRSANPCNLCKLLDLDGRDSFELLRDRSRVVLRDVLLDGLGGAVDEILGFLEAETRDFADRLDGRDLVCAGILEDDGELGLNIDRARRRAGGSWSRRRNCCRRRNAETLFELLDQSRS